MASKSKRTDSSRRDESLRPNIPFTPGSTLGTGTLQGVNLSPQVAGPSNLVKQGDTWGVFQPLVTIKEGEISPGDLTKTGVVMERLQGEIDALRQQLVRANTEIASLQKRLADFQRKAAPDDIAAAIQNSVDNLQTQLASLSNPTSNFGVKEFRLEAPVAVNISTLGLVEYRFVQPDDVSDAATLSRLSLTLVPIEKATGVGTLSPELFDFRKGLHEVPGIEEKTLQVLSDADIHTVREFVAVASRARIQVELTSRLQMERARLLDLVAQAELLQLRGLDTRRASLLQAAGLRSMSELARVSPERLVSLMKDGISPDEAGRWILAARHYLGIKTSGS